MGRPPIGGKAMSAAERVRRYRERLRQAQPPKAAPKAKATTPPSDEVAALKKRIADLEAEVARLRGLLAEPEKQQPTHEAQTTSTPQQQTFEPTACRNARNVSRDKLDPYPYCAAASITAPF
jgi:TolA-binding protein